MKKTALLHSALSGAIAGLGHGDVVIIGDAGLPCPNGPNLIDLALTPGIPSFADTLRAVLSEMQVERAIIATQTRERSPVIASCIESLLEGVQIDQEPHDALKRRCAHARWFVRTGECTPYANVLLVAGVTF